MKITKLELHNFGVYAGDNTLDFSNKKPVVLIGGLNGRGKTTILEAILLALYGKRSFAFEESKITFPKYLAALVNAADLTHTAWIELEFLLPADGGDVTYRVQRAWTSKVATPTLKTVVQKNNILDPLLSENWDVFVEEMLPSAVAPFFFFDGEKIADLVSTDNSDASMKNSIRALLGITVIDQAIADIDKVAKAKQKKIKSDTLDKEIELLDAKIVEAEADVKMQRITLSTLSVKRTQLEKKLRAAENKFATSGGNLAVNRNNLLAKREALTHELNEVTSQILEAAAGDLPLLLVLPLLKSTLANIEKEHEQKSIRAALDRLPTLFAQYGAAQNISFDFSSFLDYVKSTASNPLPEYGMTDQGLFQMRHLCATLDSSTKAVAVQALEKKSEILEAIANVENYLAINVNEAESNKLYETVISLTSDLATVVEQLRVAELSVAQSEAHLAEAQRARNKVVERVVGSMEAADDTKRILTYCGYTVKVLNEYKVRLQKEKVSYLAQTMTACFRQLASKHGLISEIKIDPITLDFQYFNSQNKPVDHSTFSAGEKQLLVIAMLWGLGICSRKQLPIIIDTPLARLDNAHRKALIHNYFPKASEQTILLSTDSEINGKSYEMLKPYIDKSYTLVFDDDEHCTKIKSGYFMEGAR